MESYENVIFNEDCLDGLKKLPDASVDLIVTSPPYNKLGLRGGKKEHYSIWEKGNNIQYATYNDNMPEEEYERWQLDVLSECFRVLKDGGSIFYNHKIRRYKKRGHFPLWIFNTDFNFYQMIIWNRKTVTDCNLSYLSPTTELIFWLTKGNPKTVNKNNCLYKSEVWDIVPKKTNFPAPFPEELAQNCILLASNEGDIVLDPFMGSGTTAKMAILNNRKYVGFEISEEYCKLIKERLNNQIITRVIKFTLFFYLS